MKKKVSIAFVFAAFVVTASLAGATSLAGVSLPDTVTVSGKSLRLNGAGIRTKFLFKIYVIGLYLENPTRDSARAIGSEESKRVVMHLVYKNVTKKQLGEAWEDGFEKNTPSPSAAVKEGLAKLESWMGDISAGQEIVFTWEPGKGTDVRFAGEEKGTIPGEDFMRALWSVWLGPHPPSEDLKKGLLGEN